MTLLRDMGRYWDGSDLSLRWDFNTGQMFASLNVDGSIPEEKEALNRIARDGARM